MKLALIGATIILSTNIYAQKKETFNPDQKYSPDSIRVWTKQIMDAVSESQPGFYRYTSKERFEFLIDSTRQTVTDSLNTVQFYRKLKPLFAQIGCLHTAVRLSEPYQKHIDERFSLLPIEVFIDGQNRVFVTKNYTDSPIPIKAEVISINGRPIDQLLNTMYEAIPTDGYNQTLKTLLLNYRFAFWYQSMIALENTYMLKTKYKETTKTFQLSGVKPDVFPTFKSIESANQKQLVFQIKEGIGYLTIRSFAKSVIKKNGQNFQKFIKQTFETIENQKIGNLVIDVRHNTGGTDSNAAFLTSHFFDQPFAYWDKIELTETMAKQIKGIYRIFYSKPEKVDSTYRWKGSILTKEFNHYNIQPAKKTFLGNTYVIANGSCMSSCSDFVAILSHNKKAKVIGQESGGGYQGNTSGLMPTEEIDPNMVITVPLLKYTNAVNLTQNIGRGTIPDYPLDHTLEDWISKKDIEMEFVNQLLKNE